MSAATRSNARGRGYAYTGAILGGAVSIAANVAHSYVPPTAAPPGWAPQPGAVIGAIFWPVFLFIAIEILARFDWPAGFRWIAVRFLGLLPVAVVAAVVSYRHLSGLLHFYGEDALTVAIGPLAVDGLMVMATGALIAAGIRRAVPIEPMTTAEPVTAGEPVDQPATEPPAPLAIVPNDATPTPTAKRPPRKTSTKPATATAVVRLRERHPDMPTAEIAKRLKVTDRTVRRHLSATTTAGVEATPAAA